MAEILKSSMFEMSKFQFEMHHSMNSWIFWEIDLSLHDYTGISMTCVLLSFLLY